MSASIAFVQVAQTPQGLKVAGSSIRGLDLLRDIAADAFVGTVSTRALEQTPGLQMIKFEPAGKGARLPRGIPAFVDLRQPAAA
jgi:hypothetical protein